jgi:hypothetical protein
LETLNAQEKEIKEISQTESKCKNKSDSLQENNKGYNTKGNKYWDALIKILSFVLYNKFFRRS